MRNITRREDGFTLVELLVVIVIIVALAAIAVPLFLSQSEKAKDAAEQSDLVAISKVVAADLVNNAGAPSNAAGTALTDFVAEDEAGAIMASAATGIDGGVDLTYGSNGNFTLVGDKFQYDTTVGKVTPVTP